MGSGGIFQYSSWNSKRAVLMLVGYKKKHHKLSIFFLKFAQAYHLWKQALISWEDSWLYFQYSSWNSYIARVVHGPHEKEKLSIFFLKFEFKDLKSIRKDCKSWVLSIFFLKFSLRNTVPDSPLKALTFNILLEIRTWRALKDATPQEGRFQYSSWNSRNSW